MPLSKCSPLGWHFVSCQPRALLVNQEFSLKIAGILGDAAQSKAVATPIVILGVDVAGIRIQVAPVGSGTSRIRPPVAIRRTRGEVAVGTVVVASTQELERPLAKQSGRHETEFHAQQAISLLAPISK